MPVFARQHPGRTGVHLALDGHRLLFCYFIFIRRIILLYLPTSRHLLGVIQQQLDKRKLVFLLFCGFERRLLATVRGTAATAVAFPQKSESTFPHQQLDKRKLVFLLFVDSKGGSWQQSGGLLQPPWLFRRKANPPSRTKNRQVSTEICRFLLIHYSLFIFHYSFFCRSLPCFFRSH